MSNDYKLIQEIIYPINSLEFLKLTRGILDSIKSDDNAMRCMSYLLEGGEHILKDHLLVCDMLTSRYAGNRYVIELSGEQDKVTAKLIATPEIFYINTKENEIAIWEYLSYLGTQVGSIIRLYCLDGALFKEFNSDELDELPDIVFFSGKKAYGLGVRDSEGNPTIPEEVSAKPKVPRIVLRGIRDE